MSEDKDKDKAKQSKQAPSPQAAPAAPPKRGRGRPSKMTEEVKEEILERLRAGETLLKISQDDHIPSHKNVLLYLTRDPEYWRKYTQAREIQMNFFADEILQIADNVKKDLVIWDPVKGPIINRAAVDQARLAIDTRKFLMAKIAPHIYGNGPLHGANVSITLPDVHFHAREEISRALQSAQRQVAKNVATVKDEYLELIAPEESKSK